MQYCQVNESFLKPTDDFTCKKATNVKTVIFQYFTEFMNTEHLEFVEAVLPNLTSINKPNIYNHHCF